MKVDIYSDIVCPWCYIGKARFEKALAAFSGAADVEVRHRPYQLDPASPSGMPLLEYLAGRYGANAQGMAAHAAEQGRVEGITLDFGRALAANTLDAHRLLWMVARKRGDEAQRQAVSRLFEAHFVEGRDVSDYGVLSAIGAEVGLADVRERLASAEGRTEVREEIQLARQRGIRAVPTFVFEDRWGVQGAQPVPAMLEALERAARGE